MLSRNHSFRRFLAYALEYKALLALAIGMGLVKFGLNYTFPWLIGTALDKVVAPVQQMTADQRLRWLWGLVWLGVFLSVLHSIATYGRGYYTAKLGNRIIRDLRQDLFDHLHQLSLHFYAKERTGSIVSRLINDIQTASQLINGGIVSLVMDCFSIALGIWILAHISWRMMLATLVIMPLYAVTFKFLNPRVKLASLRVQSQISKISGNVQERLAGISLVKTYAAEERESERFREDTEEHYDRVLVQSNLSQTVSAISEGLIHLGQTIVIGVGGYLALRPAIDGGISAGEVTKVIGTLAVMYLPVRRFAEINVIYQTSLAAIERVFQVFDITPNIVEKPDALAVVPQRGHVRFESISFTYHDDSAESRTNLEERTLTQRETRLSPSPSTLGEGRGEGPTPNTAAELLAMQRHSSNGNANGNGNGNGDVDHRRWVLRDVQFDVAPGQRVALVGPSGSGKSTLASLLPRLYDVSSGRILIDDVDVRDYNLRKLRQGIGIVQQDSFLFSGSIRENIAYGRPDAADAQVIDAAKAANAHDFITALPDGYDSRLGERGVNLSGGQRQRLSIARAILKDPRILILDEATSALDSESEAVVQEALSRLMQGRTCLIIAHRLSTVRDADRIIVLEAGRIVETGRHQELCARPGLYARLVHQQFGPGAVLRAG